MQQTKSERLFSIEEFRKVLGGASYEDKVLFTRIDSDNVDKFNNIAEDMFLTRSIENIICNILVISGELTGIIDYRKYVASAHSSFAFLPFKVLSELKGSSNLKAFVFICSNEYIVTEVLDKKPGSISKIINSDKEPVRHFNDTEYMALKNSMLRIEQYLMDSDHLLRKEIVLNAIYNVMLESANIYMKYAVPQTTEPQSSIKERYIKRFLEELVKHGDKEHSPSFYADKLCISVQYLSLILKEVSGKTANTWIAKYLITRAKVMLRKPENTIQQVAETLHFSDQSSFGKFFKKHVGSSPKRYQEENTIF